MGMYIEEIFGTDTAFNASICTEETELENVWKKPRFSP